MTAPEIASNPNWQRFGRYFARVGWAHLLLLTGVAIFLFPFVWMIGMSIKTDEEATTTKLFPTLPEFRASSPSLKPIVPFTTPASLSDSQWSNLLPTLKSWAVDKLSRTPLPAGGQFVDLDSLRNSAALSLISYAVERLNESVWIQTTDKLKPEFESLLTPEALTTALDHQIGRLCFRGLQVRMLDAKIFTIFRGIESLSSWHVVSGNGQLIPGTETAILKYHFGSSSDPPVVLTTTFPFPGDPAQLHALVVSMTGDDSWHRIDATFDIDGRRWESVRPKYIAQYRDDGIVFQPPGFDDTTYQPKTWVSLKPAGSSSSPPGQATLTLTLRPSSTLRAIYGKVEKNYLRAMDAVPFWKYITNSLFLVVMQVGGALFSSAFVAYAFARLNWPGKTVAFGLLLSTMMLPSQVTMIPSFLIWKSLGWYNTLNPLWVPAWFGSAFFIFLMTQHMKTIPRELEEAARIDGLNAVQTWWYIILPLVKPTLAAIAIMVFMGAWNDFLGPLIMIRDQSKFPLSLGLFGLKLDSANGSGTDFTLVMAGNMLMTLPVIAIFFLFQRYFIEGVTVSGMKG